MMLLHYLKYFLFHAIGLLALTMLMAGGIWVSVGLVAVLVWVINKRK